MVESNARLLKNQRLKQTSHFSLFGDTQKMAKIFRMHYEGKCSNRFMYQNYVVSRGDLPQKAVSF